jgi:ABC-type transport system involved in multi-copper enzyme maturation permease subunit
MTAESSTIRTATTGTWGVFRGESSRWLGRRGLFHLLLWLFAVEWALYINVVTPNQPFGFIGFQSLINLLSVLPMIAGVVLAAAQVCGDYNHGTAAWMLSKPVPRSGYTVASVSALWLGLTTTAIVVPGMVAYWWLPRVDPYRFVKPDAPDLARFLTTLGLLSLVLAFFMALATMLSILIRRRGVVVAIAAWVLLMLRVPILSATGWIEYTPAMLIRTDLTPGGWSKLTEFIYGLPLGATDAVAGTLGLTALFMVVAMLIFHRLEL